jgi:hypothetical protein
MLAAAFGPVHGAEAPAPAPAADDPRAVLRAYFTEEDAAARATLAARFAAVAPKSWPDLKTMLHAAAPRPALPPGRQRFETRGDAAVPAIRYILRVPAGYAADAARGWPLIIACHGLGGSGEGALAEVEAWLEGKVEQFLVAAAESPTPGPYVARRENIEYPLRVLEDVRQRANVDSDRTVLMGFSKGGYATWGTILFSPGEWAAAAPMASWPVTEAGAAGDVLYLPNVLRLSIQAHWGANDIEAGQKEGISTFSREVAAEFKRLGARQFEGIEYPGEGHGLKVKADRLRDFLTAARRDPWPAECRLIFHRLYQGRAYYVRATAAAKDEFDFRQKRVLTIARKEDLDKARRDLWLREGYDLTGRMPPTANLVAVLARNLKEVEVDLAAEKLDFTRPIRCTVNTRTAQEGPRKLDWAELLETARRTGDFERLVGGRVRLTVPGAK